jgi:MarR family transcriptional regulator, organic hydroperoxide resistance regulator
MRHDVKEEIIGRLLDLFRRMQENFQVTTAEFGLSTAEGQALHRLDAPLPMGAMADAMHCDASYITQITDRLEAAGLVERSTDPTDRRVRQLVLTEDGREMRHRLVERIHATSPAFRGLDDEEQATLLGLLRKLGEESH